MMSMRRVLISEDEPVTRRLLSASVGEWGYQVIATVDGKQAQEELMARSVDVCILDWEMPRMTGIELCEWLRGANLHSEPYVILLTARTKAEEIRVGYRAGANDYIGKPFVLEDLRRRLGVATQRIECIEQVRSLAGACDPVDLYRHDLSLYKKSRIKSIDQE